MVVVIAAQHPSFLAPTTRPGFFPGWLAGPLGGLWPGLTIDPATLEWLVSALIAAMYAFYVVAFIVGARLRARWTVGTLLSLHVIFFLAPPLSYTDVFNYINYGRIGVLHHLNPYTALPVLAPHADPSFALSNWHHLLSPYGQLFTLLTYALVPLGVAVSFWVLKLVLAIASLTALALVWRCAQLLGRSPTAAVLFVGCNPIVLVWGLGADHNDALMMLFVMLAVYCRLRAPPASLLAGFALVSAVFVKASAAVLLPIFLVAGGSRRRLVAGGLAALGVLGAASLVAFGAHSPGLSTQSSLVTAIGIPNLVGLALGQGGETGTLHTVFDLIVVVAIALCTTWAARRKRDWLTASAVVLVVLVVSLSWAAPWYLFWALPFVALSRADRLRVAVVVLGAYFILAFMPAAARLENSVGFRPASTALGVRHERQIGALVR